MRTGHVTTGLPVGVGKRVWSGLVKSRRDNQAIPSTRLAAIWICFTLRVLMTSRILEPGATSRPTHRLIVCLGDCEQMATSMETAARIIRATFLPQFAPTLLPTPARGRLSCKPSAGAYLD